MDEYFREKLFAIKLVLNVMRRHRNQWFLNLHEEFLSNVSEHFHPSIQEPVNKCLDWCEERVREMFPRHIPPDSQNSDGFIAFCIERENDIVSQPCSDAETFIIFSCICSLFARVAFERGIQNAPFSMMRAIYSGARRARHAGTFSNSFWAEDIPNAAMSMSRSDPMRLSEDVLLVQEMVQTVLHRHHGRPTTNYYQNVGERYCPKLRMAILFYLERNALDIRGTFTELIALNSLNEDNFSCLCTNLGNEWITSGSNTRYFIEFCCNLSEFARLAQEIGIHGAPMITIRNIFLAVSRARNRGVIANDFWREGIQLASLEICQIVLGINDENNTLFATNLVESVIKRHSGWRPNYPGFPERFPDGSSTRFYGGVNSAMHAFLNLKGGKIQTRFAEDMLFNSLNEHNFEDLCLHLVSEMLACGLEARRFIELCCSVSEYSRLAFEREIHRAPHIAIFIISSLMSSRIFQALPDYFWEEDIPRA